MKYIYHHLGLGDHIICNGLVRSLVKETEQYTMFVKRHNLTSVSFMYKDLNNLTFLVGDDFYAKSYIKDNKIPQSDLIIAGFFRHPRSKQFDDSFYLQNNLPFTYRWEKFKCDRDLIREKKLFDFFDVKEKNYIFIHDDIDRGYEIDERSIVNKDMQIIRPKKNLTDNIFDYCYLMENSVESHFIDSSFKLTFDSYQLMKENIFYHINLKNGVVKDNTFSQSILNFKII